LRWFKHLTRAHLDETITPLLDSAGAEGYGYYWIVCEIVAEAMDKTDRCSLSHSDAEWARQLRTTRPKVSKLLANLSAIGLMEVSEVRNSLGKKIEVRIPKLLKYRDEYSKKSGHSPDTLPTDSGQTPDTLPTKDTETEADAENTTNTQGGKTFEPDTRFAVSQQTVSYIGAYRLDESFVMFKDAAERYGMQCSEQEWGTAHRFAWSALQMPERLDAIRGIEDRISAGDSSLVNATPKNYLQDRKWKRNIGQPPPQPRTGSSTRDRGLEHLKRKEELLKGATRAI
jgi:hypothetical protein